MNFCTSCGNKIDDRTRYCSQCGVFVKNESSINIKEEKAKFCGQCGNLIAKEYCGQCGTSSRNIQVKVGGRLGNSLGAGLKKKENNRAAQQSDPETGFHSFLGLQSATWKDMWKSAGIFAGSLLVFMIILTFVGNLLAANGVDHWVGEKLKHASDKLDVQASIRDFSDFKSTVWAMLHGLPLIGKVSSGSEISYGMKMELPFLLLPITFLIIWLFETIRKAITGVQRTLVIAVMEAGLYGIAATITTMFMKGYMSCTEDDNKWMWRELGDTFGHGDSKYIFTFGSPIGSTFFTIFLLTLLVLLLLPGMKAENTCVSNVFSMAKKSAWTLFLLVVCAGTMFAIIQSERLFPGAKPAMGVAFIPFGIGMVASGAFGGSLDLFSIKNHGSDELAYFTSKQGLLNITSKISDADHKNKIVNSEHSPYGWIHIILWIVVLAVLVIFAWKLWSSRNWRLMTAIFVSVGIGCLCSGMVMMLQKLYCYFLSFTGDGNSVQAWMGNYGLVGSFIKLAFVYAAIIFVTYVVMQHVLKMQSGNVSLHTAWFTVAACILSLIVTFFGFETIETKDYNQYIHNYFETMGEYYYIAEEGEKMSESDRKEMEEEIDEYLKEHDLQDYMEQIYDNYSYNFWWLRNLR